MSDKDEYFSRGWACAYCDELIEDESQAVTLVRKHSGTRYGPLHRSCSEIAKAYGPRT